MEGSRSTQGSVRENGEDNMRRRTALLRKIAWRRETEKWGQKERKLRGSKSPPEEDNKVNREEVIIILIKPEPGGASI